jgi:16S rRNA (adenine1518-N6/adenine1519-N6)-dimethyltransferase
MGQHFLGDARVARAIAGALPDAPPRVVEIGPGRGALTRPLLDRFPRVRALELDGTLARDLPRAVGSPAGLEVIAGDAVAADLDALAADGPWLVAGNLPYSVATPIVRRLVRRGDLFAEIVVMVQLEVAERLTAGPRGRGRGLLSVEVEGFAAAELLFRVAPRCFAPPPRVASAVVRLRPRPPDAVPARIGDALRLAGAAFTHRRKALANALAGSAPAAALAAALAAAGIDPRRRAEELALTEWLALAAALAP